MSRAQRVRSAAVAMAKTAHAAERHVLNPSPVALFTWDELHPAEQRARIVGQIAVLRHCSEDVLDALLGVGKGRRQHGRRPSPTDLSALIEDTRAGLAKAEHDYAYLHSSGYDPPRGRGKARDVDEPEDDEERTGSGDQDLGSGIGRRMAIGRCLDAAADRVFRARELVLGAEKALSDAAGIIDESHASDGVAEVEVVPDAEALANREQAQAAQRRRNGRSGSFQWQGERAG